MSAQQPSSNRLKTHVSREYSIVNSLSTALVEAITQQTPRIDAAQLENEVHVWSAVVSDLDLLRTSLESVLTPSERSRAASFKAAASRPSFIARRALLRKLLCAYLGVTPGELVFASNRYGKPRVLGCNVEFSVSTSKGVILLAFARNRKIGVDVEYTNIDFDFQAVAEHNFAPAEQGWMAKLSPAVAKAAFFSYWTRKEAFVKAVGYGLSLPLNSFEVPLIEAAPIVLHRQDQREELQDWRLMDLSVDPSYRAALAVEGKAPWLPRCMWSNGKIPGII